MKSVWIVVERFMYANLPEYIKAVFDSEDLADIYIREIIKKVKGTDRESHMFIKREWVVNNELLNFNKVKEIK